MKLFHEEERDNSFIETAGHVASASILLLLLLWLRFWVWLLFLLLLMTMLCVAAAAAAAVVVVVLDLFTSNRQLASIAAVWPRLLIIVAAA